MTNIQPTEQPVDESLLKEQLAEAKRQRLQTCQIELADLLRRHGCALRAHAQLTQDGRVVAEPILTLLEVEG